jgi:tRNA pseudouridine55 synthase
MRDGLLLVDKRAGRTSHDEVQRARRLVGQRKIGHCGTLDPDATGLLVLTLGRATRLTRFLINAPKVYSGTIRFGIATDTYDASGKVLATRPTDELSDERIAEAMHRLEGVHEQAAPAFSAKKLKGVKYYEMARRGEEVPESLKSVTVYELKPTGELTEDRLPFELGCSSGTYVRSLAHELGEALGCGAHLAELRRRRVGPFDVENAVPLTAIEGASGSPGEVSGSPGEAGGDPAETDLSEVVGGAWVPFDAIPLPFPELATDPQQERRIGNGQTVLFRDLASEEGDWVKLVNRRQEMIAVGTVVERIGHAGVGVVQPRIVFH